MSRARQTATGLALAGLILAAWLSLHLYGVFLHRWSAADWLLVPLLVALQTWLGTGLFIVAHDAIHGSLAPGRPELNRSIGQVCVALYAGFSFARLAQKHRMHHAAPGSDADPDFHPAAPTAFVPWFARFFRTYFGWRELAAVSAVLTVYVLALGTSPLNAAVFWGLPAILSALQLFTFGTYLPHRHGNAAFRDPHRARSLDYPWLLSLAACFHFGRHHEHHLHPSAPWWRLPGLKA
jgi:beta-carotene/zeaxanthin 4-ketolase